MKLLWLFEKWKENVLKWKGRSETATNNVIMGSGRNWSDGEKYAAHLHP